MGDQQERWPAVPTPGRTSTCVSSRLSFGQVLLCHPSEDPELGEEKCIIPGLGTRSFGGGVEPLVV